MSKKYKVNDSAKITMPCILCNPKKYLKFSFAFINYESYNPKNQDIVKLYERIRWLSQEPYEEMIYKFGKDKDKFFEKIPIKQIKKQVPLEFRKYFPTETNEVYHIMRVYPCGAEKGTANPRIIGMIKHTIFYIFFLDWEGKLYDHGR